MKPVWYLIFCVAICTSSLHASTVTVDFDDLSNNHKLQGSYKGIIWELGINGFSGNTGNLTALSQDAGETPAYTSPVSMINEWGVRTVGMTFEAGRVNFFGAHFLKYAPTASFAAPTVGFVGYRNGETVYLSPIYRTSNIWGFASVQFMDVDRVEIISAAGSNGSAGWYYMDNLRYAPVPEPSGLPVLAGPVALLFWRIRRRAQRADASS